MASTTWSVSSSAVGKSSVNEILRFLSWVERRWAYQLEIPRDSGTGRLEERSPDTNHSWIAWGNKSLACNHNARDASQQQVHHHLLSSALKFHASSLTNLTNSPLFPGPQATKILLPLFGG